MYACLLGLTKCVTLLLKRGANSQLLDNNGHTGRVTNHFFGGWGVGRACESVNFPNISSRVWI